MIMQARKECNQFRMHFRSSQLARAGRLEAISYMDVESALRSRAIGTSHGYAEIKVKQRDAILPFVSGKDVFISLPTGKSF